MLRSKGPRCAPFWLKVSFSKFYLFDCLLRVRLMALLCDLTGDDLRAFIGDRPLLQDFFDDDGWFNRNGWSDSCIRLACYS